MDGWETENEERMEVRGIRYEDWILDRRIRIRFEQRRKH